MRLDPREKLEPTLSVNAARQPVWPVDMPPSLFWRILNASKSFLRNFWHITKGNTPGQTKLQTKRARICQACEFQRQGVCVKCGCFLKAKTWLKAEACPVGKW
jgi:hypothetical protein